MAIGPLGYGQQRIRCQTFTPCAFNFLGTFVIFHILCRASIHAGPQVAQLLEVFAQSRLEGDVHGMGIHTQLGRHLR